MIAAVALMVAGAGLITGCDTFKQMFNIGDGYILGVVAYTPPSGALAGVGELAEDASIGDVLFALGIDLATEAMMDKWNIEDVSWSYSDGSYLTTVATQYGTFTVSTGELLANLTSVWFTQAADGAIEVNLEDASGTVQTGTVQDE
jgi:hypothetical protein